MDMPMVILSPMSSVTKVARPLWANLTQLWARLRLHELQALHKPRSLSYHMIVDGLVVQVLTLGALPRLEDIPLGWHLEDILLHDNLLLALTVLVLDHPLP